MTGKTVLQLGYGMQGKAALADLVQNRSVSTILVADGSEEVMRAPEATGSGKVRPVRFDASDRDALAKLMGQADVVVELLPGPFALPTARLAAEVGIPLVSAMYLANPGETDPAERERQRRKVEAIDREAQAKGIALVEEFGMDPGLDLALGREALRRLDSVVAFHSYGAGFPEKESSDNPLRYRFTWSVIGVMRSYLRPARYLRGGAVIDVAADEMFSPRHSHILDLPEMEGPLECFPNGDAAAYARRFAIADQVKDMGRYICRWPGHGAFWSVMARSGFLSERPVDCGDVTVTPNAFCAALLGSQDQFFYGEGQRDVALVRTDVRGYREGRPCRIVGQIVDRRDLTTGFTAMQRTVGFPVSIAASMILDGRIDGKGLLSPMEIPFGPLVEELSRRDISVSFDVADWDGRVEP